jgi:hypothetical protein
MVVSMPGVDPITVRTTGAKLGWCSKEFLVKAGGWENTL